MDKRLLKYFDNDELAASAWLSKYKNGDEVTPDDMHKRLAKEFAKIEYEHILKDNELEHSVTINDLSDYGKARFNRNNGKLLPRDLFKRAEDEIYTYFKDFKYIIPQGSVMSMLGTQTIGSLSNCFVIGEKHDSYGSIMRIDEEQIQLMKRRGGVGHDLSHIRPNGTEVNNSAKTSTGIIPFMNRYSNSTREVAQGGRRGALMLSIDIRHPDSLDFIKSKRDITKITGANISVKIDSSFMQAVEKNEDFILRYPIDLEVTDKHSAGDYNELVEEEGVGFLRKVKAREYWDEIIKSAHSAAEPGIIFEDNHIQYSPDSIYEQYKGICTNPCGEIFMQPYDACRLIVTNLFSFVDNPFTKDALFNMDKFYRYNYEAMRMADHIIDLEIGHIDRILDKIDSDKEPESIKRVERELWIKVKKTALSSRRAGLGFTALGDALAALGLKYDSKEAMKVVESIMHTKLKSELDCTIDLAIQRGTFKGYSVSTEYDNYDETDDGPTVGKNPFYQFILDEFPEQFGRMLNYGRRNISWSTLAPTGTVSLMSQTTSGIEPMFMPFYMRRKKINPDNKDERVDFIDEVGDSWQEFPVLHEKFKDWITIAHPHFVEGDIPEMSKEDLQQCFEESPWYGSTANDIDWVQRVEMQAIIQSYTTHSISSTINLPSTVTEEEVSEIYLESWKRGLKGVTVNIYAALCSNI